MIFNVLPIDISGLQTDSLYVFDESDLDSTKPEVIAFFDTLK